ncbi:MmgE/PrpD family protein [Celeribacter neptunius]|uniref:2-methylcitrate dehydratase PrpD n=1 Tax=Celeribacter neptunius TaxID=588602 RepID=A0A1I3RAX8_9RHOB|nr:MmgE/PrpD family protein [Celeribacter neptunius]SFJ43200.1 2-methylcitrate dehydratase PrpD [Celeribacter neptunius]
MSTPDLVPLAAFVSGYMVDPDDAALASRLRSTVLDWGSAALAGTGHPLFSAYQTAFLSPGEQGPLRVIGTSGRHPMIAAAMTNAALSHLWEVDDAHRDATNHPGITVLPAVMALAEAHRLDPATVCAAIVAGYEAVIRVSAHLGAPHYAINHSTATAGSFGAAAAAARALRFSPEQTLSAFGHAGTQAAGLWALLDDDCTESKAFHAAMAVRNGLQAVQLVQSGLPGAPRILEGPRGMRASWHLTDTDAAWLAPDGAPLIHTVTIKGWPVCGQMHSALDCAADLARRVPQDAAAAGPVTVRLPESALAIAGRQAPTTVAEAKFSTSFCIAATLCGKPPSLAGLTEALVVDPEIQRRAEDVTLVADAAMTARFPKERPAEVCLETPSGPQSERRSFRRGDPEAPWTDAAMIERTRDVLALTPWETRPEVLIRWADALVAHSPGWAAETLHEALLTTR